MPEATLNLRRTALAAAVAVLWSVTAHAQPPDTARPAAAMPAVGAGA